MTLSFALLHLTLRYEICVSFTQEHLVSVKQLRAQSCVNMHGEATMSLPEVT